MKGGKAVEERREGRGVSSLVGKKEEERSGKWPRGM